MRQRVRHRVAHGCHGARGEPRRCRAEREWTFDGTQISGNGRRGLDFWNIANKYTVKLRRANVVNNGQSGLYVTGAADSTLADPGGNTFTGNNTSNTSGEAGVRIALTDTLVPAVGNTWIASQQDADASGKYSATGGGAVLDVTTGTGPNYAISAGTTLRLAQNP